MYSILYMKRYKNGFALVTHRTNCMNHEAVVLLKHREVTRLQYKIM